MSAYEFHKHNLLRDFCEFWFVYHTINRKAELNRLVAWAQTKRLTYPLHLYRNRLEQTGRILFRLALTRPRTFRYARLLYQTKNLLFIPPKYHSKGTARYYAKKSLTAYP